MNNKFESVITNIYKYMNFGWLVGRGRWLVGCWWRFGDWLVENGLWAVDGGWLGWKVDGLVNG